MWSAGRLVSCRSRLVHVLLSKAALCLVGVVRHDMRAQHMRCTVVGMYLQLALRCLCVGGS